MVSRGAQGRCSRSSQLELAQRLPLSEFNRLAGCSDRGQAGQIATVQSLRVSGLTLRLLAMIVPGGNHPLPTAPN